MLRTQHGNNNGYCQDNDTCWMQWQPDAMGQEMFRFMKELIQYRKHLFQRPEQESMPLSLTEILRHSEICWHGVNAAQPDFSPHSHAIAMSALSSETRLALYVLFNAYWEPLTFNLPSPKGSVATGAGSWIPPCPRPRTSAPSVCRWRADPGVPGPTAQQLPLHLRCRRLLLGVANQGPHTASKSPPRAAGVGFS